MNGSSSDSGIGISAIGTGRSTVIGARAGISLPMITFSLRPRRWSVLPSIAASVSTRVVSWKEAAARNESVLSEARVTPCSIGDAKGAVPPSELMRVTSRSKSWRSTGSCGRKSLSPGSSMLTRRIIWRTITSMWRSLMLTPWER